MSSPSLRYVVLRHEGIPQPHFDVMFETAVGSALATWRVNEWPLTSGALIEHLADHRRAYLEYEGPVSGGRGHVSRVAAGTHTVRSNDPDRLVVALDDGPCYGLFRSPTAVVQILK